MVHSKTTWRLNVWAGENCVVILYAIFTVAVALQQFPATEPAAIGFFWITVVAFLLGSRAAIVLGVSNPAGLLANAAIQSIAIGLQILLFLTCWEELVKIDEVVRGIRAALAATLVPGSTHLLPMRVVWLFFTTLILWSAWKRGTLFRRVGQRPW